MSPFPAEEAVENSNQGIVDSLRSGTAARQPERPRRV
jgi:hypothetical protein